MNKNYDILLAQARTKNFMDLAEKLNTEIEKKVTLDIFLVLTFQIRKASHFTVFRS